MNLLVFAGYVPSNFTFAFVSFCTQVCCTVYNEESLSLCGNDGLISWKVKVWLIPNQSFLHVIHPCFILLVMNLFSRQALKVLFTDACFHFPRLVHDGRTVQRLIHQRFLFRVCHSEQLSCGFGESWLWRLKVILKIVFGRYLLPLTLISTNFTYCYHFLL